MLCDVFEKFQEDVILIEANKNVPKINESKNYYYWNSSFRWLVIFYEIIIKIIDIHFFSKFNTHILL